MSANMKARQDMLGPSSIKHAGPDDSNLWIKIGDFDKITPWQKANASYAKPAWNNRNFNEGNVYTNAAARSGVVNPAGYGEIPTAEEVNAAAHARGITGGDKHAKQMGHRGIGYRWTYPINRGLRYRIAGDEWRSTGWVSQLTQSSGPNKAFGIPGAAGRGQSSQDSTTAVYSTDETRMGTRAQFTDESWNEVKKSFSQSWAGYKDLGKTGATPHLNAQLGQMYTWNNPNVGFARRVKRGL